ncbi:MAG TPA: HD domain-containing phosphohydrolase [Nitrospira sp.]|nr:HD domain-containing phosphohydrolase [Nitrospira sp.]
MQPLTAQKADPIASEVFTILREHRNLQIPVSARRLLELQTAWQVSAFLDRALPWQRGHGRRTAALAQCLGLAAGFSRETLHHVTLASLLHDIGLLVSPNRVPAHGRYLDLESYVFVQCHPRLGAQWLEAFPFLGRASVIIAHHHERWDGSGYPYGIRGLFIPKEARVLSIADAFDSMDLPGVSDPKLRDQMRCRIIKSAGGTQFDPHLVDLFCNRLRRPIEDSELPTAVGIPCLP